MALQHNVGGFALNFLQSFCRRQALGINTLANFTPLSCSLGPGHGCMHIVSFCVKGHRIFSKQQTIFGSSRRFPTVQLFSLKRKLTRVLLAPAYWLAGKHHHCHSPEIRARRIA